MDPSSDIIEFPLLVTSYMDAQHATAAAASAGTRPEPALRSPFDL
jgi:hypothetical protein